MTRLVSVDPGRYKCGIVFVETKTSEVLSGLVLPCENVVPQLIKWKTDEGIELILLGDGTGSACWLEKLKSIAHVQIVNEHKTTLQARKRYWQLRPASGLYRLIPLEMRIPPTDLDAFAALIILERYLKKQMSWIQIP